MVETNFKNSGTISNFGMKIMHPQLEEIEGLWKANWFEKEGHCLANLVII